MTALVPHLVSVFGFNLGTSLGTCFLKECSTTDPAGPLAVEFTSFINEDGLAAAYHQPQAGVTPNTVRRLATNTLGLTWSFWFWISLGPGPRLVRMSIIACAA